MSSAKNILIVGAGPVGLTAAIELARLGQEVTIIDKNAQRTQVSKAIGINARSLELLEASGVTTELLQAGLPLKQLQLHYDEKSVVIHIDQLPHRYNFMLSLPQDQTEMILENKLNQYGIDVRRQTEFLHLSQLDDKVIVQLNERGETIQETYDFVIGADGAHSVVRKAIGQEFTGKRYPENWNLADVHMSWNFDPSIAHAFTSPPGTVCVVIPIGENRYRIVANRVDALALLPKNTEVKDIIWHSDFAISCRIVNNYQLGHVFLAGDSAHIHTPVGGRGMNLGMEDACILAQMLVEDNWQDYNKLRHPVGKHVVNFTDHLYRLLTLSNPILRGLRNLILFPLLSLPWV
ncbi:MAG: NAD(P)/FAD-dependent oxidoreductase, partial [Polynucleobacter sp.]|nr:NAD(P)/FAD-dependent oxidoreductase [Polynucleobacter sp.]